jgi:hypothetical protein
MSMARPARRWMRDAADRFAQVVLVRQEHDAEVLLVWIVEARALHQHHAGFLQQFEEQLSVVGDGVQLGVQAREHVQRRLGLDAADARDGGDEFVGQVALAPQAAPLAHQVVDALVAAQRGLDGVLPRHVGAQAHVREHGEALDVVGRGPLVARDHQPAGTVAAGAVALGQRIEREREHVLGQAADGGVLLAVVQHLVVDLVGQDHQPVLAGDGDDAAQQVIGVQRAGRVVRVDDHDALGPRRDLAADVVQVGHPAVGLVAAVVHRRPARQAGGGGPQRIVGRRQQQFVAIVQQRIGRHGDQLAGAVAQVDVVEGDARDALLLGVVHHRLAGGEDPLAVRVPGRVAQVADHVLLDLLGGVEAEHGKVADVQLDDLVPLFLHLARGVHDGPADVIEDVGELGGFLDGLQSHSCTARRG